jgi:hypothetical protein
MSVHFSPTIICPRYKTNRRGAKINNELKLITILSIENENSEVLCWTKNSISELARFSYLKREYHCTNIVLNDGYTSITYFQY